MWIVSTIAVLSGAYAISRPSRPVWLLAGTLNAVAAYWIWFW